MEWQRDFYAGEVFQYDEIEYSISAGDRCEGDLVLDFRLLYNGWHRPSIAHMLILFEFKFQVEENNYPITKKNRAGKPYLGGMKLWNAINAIFSGVPWQSVALEIAESRIKKAEREGSQA